MDPRISTQRKGGIVILIVFVMAIGIISGVLLATGLDWVPRSVAEDTHTTQPGEAANVTPSEFLTKSQESFRDLVLAVRPAVVSVQAEGFDKDSSGTMDFHGIDPFEWFGIPNPGGPGMPQMPNPQDYPSISSGSGFLVSPDGYILTNNHVVDGADTIKIILDDGSDYSAELIGNDPETDVAVLKIEDDHEFPYLEFGDMDGVEVGDWVMAVGNPFGNLAGTVTVGIVSATGRESLQLPGDTYYQNFIQTDAAINFGNSGGPLVDISGKVIGINTAISSQGSGIGFATPVEIFEFVYNSYLEHGEVVRGWIGVTIQNFDNDLADALGLDSTEGAIVVGVTPGQPADDGGLQEGDVILEVEGIKVTSTPTASRLIAELPVGESAEFKIWRDGRAITIDISPARRATEELAMYDGLLDESPSINKDPDMNTDYLGLSVKELTGIDIADYDLPSDAKGVLIESVEPRSKAFEKGLRTGNVIVEINDQPVENLDDYTRLMTEARERWESEDKVVVMRFLAYGQTTGWVRSFIAIPFE